MIPKIIHYCWFGRNPKSKLAKKCIKSWKKYCKDFQIIEWNEDNFDIFNSPLYVRQAYEAKKWAFVSDYVRLWAMVKYGGVYMDTDVELIKPVDRFLEHDAFSGFEDGKNIPTGIMACRKNFPLFKEFLSFYNTATFYNEDGSYNLTTNVALMTATVLKYGLKQNNEFQIISGFSLYPKEVFCPVSYHTGELKKTKNTVAIHWFSGSWHSAEQKHMRKEYKKRAKAQKRKISWTNFIHNTVHFPNRILKALLSPDVYESLKKHFRSQRSK